MHENVSIIRKILKTIQWACCSLHILLNRGAMFDIATRMSRSMSILLRYFDLITVTAKNRFTQVCRCKWHKNTESFTAYKWKFRSSINPEWNKWIRVVYAFQSEVRRKIDK